jgi:hypothetical protein
MLADSTILGAVTGLLSAALMTAFEFPFWSSRGLSGVVEWQVNQILVSWVLREKYDQGRRLGEALVMHLFHGAVAGAILGAVLASLFLPYRGYFWLAGLLFSLLLWSLVPFVLRKQFERIAGTRFTNSGLAISLLSHIVYGLSLGLMLQTWL